MAAPTLAELRELDERARDAALHTRTALQQASMLRCPECPHCQALAELETKDQLRAEVLRKDDVLRRVKQILKDDNSPVLRPAVLLQFIQELEKGNR